MRPERFLKKRLTFEIRGHIISSLTLIETENGHNPAYSKGCGHFFHGIDVCYFSFRLFFVFLMMLLMLDFEMNS